MTRFAGLLLVVLMLNVGSDAVRAQQSEDRRPADQLSEETLGSALESLGLKPTKTEKRYDFAFKTSVRGEEWRFSMSAVLSRNEGSVWVMAWLDQIPRSSGDVSLTALLRLLAANDRLGNGKFFAYIPANKRFVLQRVITNEKMTSLKLRATLQDLAVSVADEYPVWATANWSPKRPQPQRVAGDLPAGHAFVPPKAAGPSRIRASESASKFQGRRIN